jgi:hypothetical protein
LVDKESTYCAWDSVELTGKCHLRATDMEWPARQRQRLQFLEGCGGAPDAAVGAEQNERLRYWLPRPAGKAAASRRAGCTGAGVLVYLGLRAVVGPIFAFLVDHALVFFGILGLLVIIAIPFDLRNRQRRRAFSALRHDICATCGYDLSGQAMQPLGDEMVRLGPPACPECGAPWPLVPPPVPLWARTQGEAVTDA